MEQSPASKGAWLQAAFSLAGRGPGFTLKVCFRSAFGSVDGAPAAGPGSASAAAPARTNARCLEAIVSDSCGSHLAGRFPVQAFG